MKKSSQIIKMLTDVRVIGQIAFAVIVIMISWSGVKAITRNHELQQEINQLEQEIEIADLKNQNLALQNEYLETDEYLDIAARESLGKAAQGEKVYVIPNDIAQKNAPKIDAIPDTATVEVKTAQGNLQEWINFFFR